MSNIRKMWSTDPTTWLVHDLLDAIDAARANRDAHAVHSAFVRLDTRLAICGYDLDENDERRLAALRWPHGRYWLSNSNGFWSYIESGRLPARTQPEVAAALCGDARAAASGVSAANGRVRKGRKVRMTRARYDREERRLLAIITSPLRYEDDTAWRALHRLRKLQADNSFSLPRSINHES